MANPSFTTHQVDPLGQVIAAGYTRSIIIFPFPNAQQRLRAAAQLRQSMKELLSRWPFLRGRIEPCKLDRTKPACTQAGRVQVVHSTSQTSERELDAVFETSVLSRGMFPYTYAELAARGMPTSALPPHLFFSDRQDLVLKTRAAFFAGGLAISFATYHAVMDGFSRATVENAWADACHALRDQSSFDYTNGPEGKGEKDLCAVLPWRTLAADYDTPEQSFEDVLSSCPEYYVSCRSGAKEARKTAPEATARLFVFSDAFVTNLRADLNLLLRTARLGELCARAHEKNHGTRCVDGCTSSLGKSVQAAMLGQSELSSYVCLTALLWSRVLAARAQHLNAAELVSLITIVNARGRAGDHIPLDYFPGNALANVITTLPLEEVTSCSSAALLLLALAMRRSIDAVDEDFLAKRARLCELAPDVRELTFRLSDDERRQGTDLVLNDWRSFGLSTEWSIHGAGTASPEWYRKPWSADVGYGVVLPRVKREGADWEVFLGFETRDEETLLRSLEGVCKSILK